MYRKIIKLIWWVILILVAKVKRFDQRKEKGERERLREREREREREIEREREQRTKTRTRKRTIQRNKKGKVKNA